MPSTDTMPTAPTTRDAHPSTTQVVIDLPNLNGHLQELGWSRSSRNDRLDFTDLAAALEQRAEGTDELTITVFMPVRRDQPQVMGFITMLRQHGIAVYARPLGDVDDNIVAAVAEGAQTTRLMVLTHDIELIRRCTSAAPSGCTTTVLGFEEFSSEAIRDGAVSFVDLGDLGDFVPESVPRSVLGRIPDAGALLPPLRRLTPATSTSPRAA